MIMLFMMMSCIPKEHTPRTPTTLPVTLSQPPRKLTQGKGIKILPLKQMLQRYRADNVPENFLNEIQEIVQIHCIKQNKFKKVCNN